VTGCPSPRDQRSTTRRPRASAASGDEHQPEAATRVATHRVVHLGASFLSSRRSSPRIEVRLHVNVTAEHRARRLSSQLKCGSTYRISTSGKRQPARHERLAMSQRFSPRTSVASEPQPGEQEITPSKGDRVGNRQQSPERLGNCNRSFVVGGRAAVPPTTPGGTAASVPHETNGWCSPRVEDREPSARACAAGGKILPT